jgi:hypothetical protein
MGKWIVSLVLLGLLAVACWFAFAGWRATASVDIPTSAYVAMAFGVVFSLIVGIGLMALVFYSNRKGYDEPPDSQV